MLYQRVKASKKETVYTNRDFAVGIIKKIKRKAKEDVLKTMKIRRL